MTSEDVRIQTLRIEKFRKLDDRAREINGILDRLEEPKIQGSGPFTANGRETRRIIAMRLDLSETLGHAPGITVDLDRLGVDAHSFGEWLETQLREQYKAVQEQLAKL